MAQLFNDLIKQPDSYLEKDYQPHYEAWKANPNPENTENLLKTVNPIINESLRIFGGGSVNSPTLRSKAKKLAISSFNSYDPSKAKLRTHLISQMQGLRRLATQEEQIINIPEQVLLDFGRVRNGENELRDRLGRDPSDAELAKHTKLSLKRIGYVRGIKPAYAEGRLTSVDEEGSSLNMPASELPTQQSQIAKAWQEFVYHDIDPLDQVIMEHTLGMHGKPVLSNQEIAAKLRLSPGAVSQRKAKLQEKLDMKDEAQLF